MARERTPLDGGLEVGEVADAYLLFVPFVGDVGFVCQVYPVRKWRHGKGKRCLI
jgi:hypothetical protein